MLRYGIQITHKRLCPASKLPAWVAEDGLAGLGMPPAHTRADLVVSDNFQESADVTLFAGDCRELLSAIPAEAARLIVHSATHHTSPSRLESVRPSGGAKFIAYERLEEVEGALGSSAAACWSCSAK